VIDARGQIQYISTIAEHLYRKLGYTESLLKRSLADLETNEYICFKAMERAVCLEQRIQEPPLIWIKKVVPLAASPQNWLERIRTEPASRRGPSSSSTTSPMSTIGSGSSASSPR